MFGRKKPLKEPDYSKIPVFPNKLAEFVQAKYGMTPDELHKLFESLGRINPTIRVARRRKVEGKEYSKPVGKGKKQFMTIAEAVEYEKTRHESRVEKDKKVHELVEEIDFDELMVRLEVNDSIYPKHLAPSDIVRSVDAAGEKLDALDAKRVKPVRIYSPREESILDVLTLIKKQEPYRVARHISERQRAYILGHSMEELEAEYAEWLRNLRGDPTPEELMEQMAQEEAQRLEEEAAAAAAAAEEAARNFGDLPSLHTLLDDVAELIRDNPEAAAAIIRLWIGNAVLLETK
jgi:sulfur carrier protein ThiS